MLKVLVPIATTITAVISLIITWRGHELTKNLLPTQQSNIVFGQNDIKTGTKTMGGKEIEVIEFGVRNIGKAAAKNVEFKVYVLPENEDYTLTDGGYDPIETKKFFDDTILHDIEPSPDMNFIGNMFIGRSANKNMQCYDFSDKKIILFFLLAYNDSIISKKNQHKYFFFQHTWGRDGLSPLLIKDGLDRVRLRLLDIAKEEKNEELFRLLER